VQRRPGFVTHASPADPDRLLVAHIILLMALVRSAAGFGVLLATWASRHRWRLSLSLAGAIVALFGLGGMLYGGRPTHRYAASASGNWCCSAAPSWTCVPWLTYALGSRSPSANLLAASGVFMFHNTMQLTP
jgi:hypothetical protein